MKKIICLSLISLMMSFAFGCKSVSTHDYKISQNVIRSAFEENPKDLQNKALVLICTPQKIADVKIKHSLKEDYGNAKISKHSFAAFVVEPGSYILNANDKIDLQKDKAYFFVFQNKKLAPISKEVFKKQYSSKFLVEQCSYFGNVQSVDDFFPDKVSTAELWGYYTVKVLTSPIYIVYGLHYVGFAGMCCFYVPVFCAGGVLLWGATYYFIPAEYRMTLSKING